MFTPVIQGMMDKGILRGDDPAMLAFAYTAPVSALIHQCDRQPDKIPEMMGMIEEFSRYFIKTYRADYENTESPGGISDV